MARKSSTFYRLEKEIGDGYKSIVEFHTVVNGNRYWLKREEMPDGRRGWNGEPRPTTKDGGNKEYKRLKEIGYKFAGIYEMDIFGVRTRVK